MQISLRKSNALQLSINEALKSIPVTSAVSLNEFQEPEGIIQSALKTLDNNVKKILELNDALYQIRTLIGNANVKSGISDRLANIAKDEKIIQLYTVLANASVRIDKAIIEGKFEKIRKSNSQNEDARQIYQGVNNEVRSSVLTENEISQYKARLALHKKSKAKLQDQVLELNIQTKIELSPEIVTLLTAENLI